MRHSVRVGLGFLLLAVVVGVMAGPAWSQQVTAAIVGTVTDPSGAPVSGATVIAKDVDRGVEWTATTNDTGAYSLPRVPVGSYEVRASAAGFQTAVHSAFTLVLNQTARIDVQMKVGQVSETVEVTGSAPILQTQSTEISTIIDAKTNASLPLASRNYIQLTLLAPGVDHGQSSGAHASSVHDDLRPPLHQRQPRAGQFVPAGWNRQSGKHQQRSCLPAQRRCDSGIQSDYAERLV